MKARLRIPTTEPYAYIECDVAGTPEKIVETYRTLTLLVNGGTGLDEKEFNRITDKYLYGEGTMTADEYAGMNIDQQDKIQWVKRSKARVKR